MERVVSSGIITLESQVRAYDLFEQLMDNIDRGGCPTLSEEEQSAANEYCAYYSEHMHLIASAYDEGVLVESVRSQMETSSKAMEDARFEAASAASLHEFAKEVYEIWQTSGIFARRRALRELRERAGFRLESHRIGNYVAKTFDLMNEAQARFARAQQACFSADVRYKIHEGIYGKISDILLCLISSDADPTSIPSE